ncbi:DUF805 domain-containing protein [Streptomyces sp. NPDC090052]|uniref:DUF805 domain-containing protein n=1 Tax=unclassified Streptomyces TaxID=2593676 RepID=UPI002255545C|nr:MULTISPECIES: DUF805 domain-containing protein [unclassified Streptomyces]MCX4725450.1 DUF805 domain-containing protein [Streptomyces sp. NBC_01306]WSV05176.1 DUF805 domain-containing protein [Streptomyces sp. NBC_01020]WSX43232.1 DUF805 domain-containing protein [Streptomyces sp. NBC_00963]WSX68751.1 DUF805 domain-containing protein [Streptomyces sp. NBC_00932]
MNWYLDVLKNYVGFSGRARRQEYWMFTLFSIIISIVLVIISAALLDNSSWLSGLYSLAVLLPTLAVTVRRLHDTGRSGGWIFIGLVPLVGWIILLVFLASEGERQSNSHGPDPKAVAGY